MLIYTLHFIKQLVRLAVTVLQHFQYYVIQIKVVKTLFKHALLMLLKNKINFWYFAPGKGFLILFIDICF